MTNSGDNSRTRRTHDDPRSELLSRAYSDAVDKAPAGPARTVDDAVLAAAHRAVETRPRSIEAGSQTLFRRWRTPLALAATLLLSIAIALRVYERGEMNPGHPHAPATRQSDQESTGVEKKAEKPQPRVGEEKRANEAAGAHPPSDTAGSSASKPTLDEPIAAKADVARKDVAPSSPPMDKAQRAHSAESGTAQPPIGTEAGPHEAQATARPFPGVPGAVPGPVPDRKQAAVPPGQVPAENTGTPALSQFRSLMRGQAARTEEEKVADVPPTEIQLLAKRLDGRPPEVWIEEIRTLKRAGRSAEAMELLAALRKKFPGFALPDDLK